MSLDFRQLHHQTVINMLSENAFLSLLFEDEIYVSLSDQAEDGVESIEGIHFYGENKLNTLVLIDFETPDVLKTPEYGLLLKIMAAVKRTPSEFALVNVQENDALTWEILESSFQPQHIIIFGTSIAETLIPIATGLYQVTQSETAQFLLSDELRHIITHPNKKKQLWMALQELFAS